VAFCVRATGHDAVQAGTIPVYFWDPLGCEAGMSCFGHSGEVAQGRLSVELVLPAAAGVPCTYDSCCAPVLDGVPPKPARKRDRSAVSARFLCSKRTFSSCGTRRSEVFKA